MSRAVALLAHRIRPLARRFGLAREEGERLGFGAPGALVHAATNVLANALDAIEGVAGEPRVQVRVVPGPRGGVEVRVSDQGIGVSEQDRVRLFVPRFTTKAPGRGSGLGLHLARQLMDAPGRRRLPRRGRRPDPAALGGHGVLHRRSGAARGRRAVSPLRVPPGLAAAGALAALAVGIVASRSRRAVPRRGAGRRREGASRAEPLPPIPFAPARPSMPPGILARAADARALERAPRCPLPPADPEPTCGAEQREEREPIEIEWEVARDP